MICDANYALKLQLKSTTLPIFLNRLSLFVESLFEISSVIPGAVLERIIEMDLPVKPDSRLFLYNAEVTPLLNLVRFLR